MMFWKSRINEISSPHIHDDAEMLPPEMFYREYGLSVSEYWEWQSDVSREPWVDALRQMVSHTGFRVCTERELFAEMRARVSKDVATSPDFPASLKILDRYMSKIEYPLQRELLAVNDYRTEPEEDRGDFYAPGWSEQQPILIQRNGLGSTPYFDEAFADVYNREDGFALMMLCFTASKRFPSDLIWRGDSKRLLGELKKVAPDHVATGIISPFDRKLRHLIGEGFGFDLPLRSHDAMSISSEMRRVAPILKAHRVEISWQRRVSLFREHATRPGDVLKLHWYTSAPQWKFPSRFR